MEFLKIQKMKLIAAAMVFGLLAGIYLLGQGRYAGGEEIQAGTETAMENSAGGASEEVPDSPADPEALPEDSQADVSLSATAEQPDNPEMIYVHVCGEVQNPGVYELSAGSRIFQAVDMAGGFTDEAAGDYVNMAGTCEDGQQIRIPGKEEVRDLPAESWASVTGNTIGAAENQAEAGTGAKVNINTADQAELMTLPGIGESRANDIITYREKKKFERIEDIKKVPGIKDGAFKKLKDRITV